MKVTSKFVCDAVTEYPTQKTVQLRAVTNGSEENKSFAAYTPSGQVQMSIDKSTEAFNFFKPGQEYYLVFEAASEQ